ncbi:hypothetical protein BC567DRAFT_237999 [Phyllosticta citribraziliensis]
MEPALLLLLSLCLACLACCGGAHGQSRACVRICIHLVAGGLSSGRGGVSCWSSCKADGQFFTEARSASTRQ